MADWAELTPDQAGHLNEVFVHVAGVVHALLKHEYEKHLDDVAEELGIHDLGLAITYTYIVQHLALDVSRSAIADTVGSEEALVVEAEALDYVRQLRIAIEGA
jgi:hypothetical protein